MYYIFNAEFSRKTFKVSDSKDLLAPIERNDDLIYAKHYYAVHSSKFLGFSKGYNKLNANDYSFVFDHDYLKDGKTGFIFNNDASGNNFVFTLSNLQEGRALPDAHLSEREAEDRFKIFKHTKNTPLSRICDSSSINYSINITPQNKNLVINGSNVFATENSLSLSYDNSIFLYQQTLFLMNNPGFIYIGKHSIFNPNDNINEFFYCFVSRDGNITSINVDLFEHYGSGHFVTKKINNSGFVREYLVTKYELDMNKVILNSDFGKLIFPFHSKITDQSLDKNIKSSPQNNSIILGNHPFMIKGSKRFPIFHKVIGHDGFHHILDFRGRLSIFISREDLALRLFTNEDSGSTSFAKLFGVSMFAKDFNGIIDAKNYGKFENYLEVKKSVVFNSLFFAGKMVDKEYEILIYFSINSARSLSSTQYTDNKVTSFAKEISFDRHCLVFDRKNFKNVDPSAWFSDNNIKPCKIIVERLEPIEMINNEYCLNDFDYLKNPEINIFLHNLYNGGIYWNWALNDNTQIREINSNSTSIPSIERLRISDGAGNFVSTINGREISDIILTWNQAKNCDLENMFSYTINKERTNSHSAFSNLILDRITDPNYCNNEECASFIFHGESDTLYNMKGIDNLIVTGDQDSFWKNDQATLLETNHLTPIGRGNTVRLWGKNHHDFLQIQPVVHNTPIVLVGDGSDAHPTEFLIKIEKTNYVNGRYFNNIRNGELKMLYFNSDFNYNIRKNSNVWQAHETSDILNSNYLFCSRGIKEIFAEDMQNFPHEDYNFLFIGKIREKGKLFSVFVNLQTNNLTAIKSSLLDFDRTVANTEFLHFHRMVNGLTIENYLQTPMGKRDVIIDFANLSPNSTLVHNLNNITISVCENYYNNIVFDDSISKWRINIKNDLNFEIKNEVIKAYNLFPGQKIKYLGQRIIYQNETVQLYHLFIVKSEVNNFYEIYQMNFNEFNQEIMAFNVEKPEFQLSGFVFRDPKWGSEGHLANTNSLFNDIMDDNFVRTKIVNRIRFMRNHFFDIYSQHYDSEKLINMNYHNNLDNYNSIVSGQYLVPLHKISKNNVFITNKKYLNGEKVLIVKYDPQILSNNSSNCIDLSSRLFSKKQPFFLLGTSKQVLNNDYFNNQSHDDFYIFLNTSDNQLTAIHNSLLKYSTSENELVWADSNYAFDKDMLKNNPLIIHNFARVPNDSPFKKMIKTISYKISENFFGVNLNVVSDAEHLTFSYLKSKNIFSNFNHWKPHLNHLADGLLNNNGWYIGKYFSVLKNVHYHAFFIVGGKLKDNSVGEIIGIKEELFNDRNLGFNFNPNEREFMHIAYVKHDTQIIGDLTEHRDIKAHQNEIRAGKSKEVLDIKKIYYKRHNFNYALQDYLVSKNNISHESILKNWNIVQNRPYFDKPLITYPNRNSFLLDVLVNGDIGPLNNDTKVIEIFHVEKYFVNIFPDDPGDSKLFLLGVYINKSLLVTENKKYLVYVNGKTDDLIFIDFDDIDKLRIKPKNDYFI